MQYVPLNHWYLCTKLQYIITHTSIYAYHFLAVYCAHNSLYRTEEKPLNTIVQEASRLHSQSGHHAKGRNPCSFHKVNSCYPPCSHSVCSLSHPDWYDILDMIYLYHTNEYLKSISFSWISGRLPVKSHTSTLKVTPSPMFTKVPCHSSAVSLVGLGTATWKHLWTRQTMWFTAVLITMPKHKLIYHQLAHWKTYVYVHSCDTS